MSEWIILAAIVAPLCFALVNLSDTYLVKSVAPIKALFLFSGLFSFIVALFFLVVSIFNGDLILIASEDILILLIAGVLEFFWIWFYLKALDGKDVSVSSIVPFFQFIGVFAYLGGLIFFNEVFSLDKLGAIALILLGGALLAIDIENFSFHLREVGYMVTAAFIIALGTLFFKNASFENPALFTVSMFWMSLGMAVSASFIYLLRRDFRNALHKMITEKKKSVSVILLNFSNEILGAIGLASVSFAAIKAPVAIVYAVGSSQYLFLFLLSLVGALFLPRTFSEVFTAKSLAFKFIALLLFILGGILLEL